MHLWFIITGFLEVSQSQPQNLFHYGCPNSLVNVNLPHFLQVQDIFYILASLVQTADTRNVALVYARHNQFTMQFWLLVN